MSFFTIEESKSLENSRSYYCLKTIKDREFYILFDSPLLTKTRKSTVLNKFSLALPNFGQGCR